MAHKTDKRMDRYLRQPSFFFGLSIGLHLFLMLLTVVSGSTYFRRLFDRSQKISGHSMHIKVDIVALPTELAFKKTFYETQQEETRHLKKKKEKKSSVTLDSGKKKKSQKKTLDSPSLDQYVEKIKKQRENRGNIKREGGRLSTGGATNEEVHWYHSYIQDQIEQNFVIPIHLKDIDTSTRFLIVLNRNGSGKRLE